MRRLLIAVLLSFACAAYAHEEPAHDHGHDHHVHARSRGVEVSEAAAKLIGLTTARAEARVLEAKVTVPARVVQNPKALRTLSARTSGFVTYQDAAPLVVAKDARLFEFYSPEAAAKYGELQALEARAAALTTAGAKNAQLKTELSVARIAYAALTNGLLVVSAEEGRFAQSVPAAGRIDDFDVAVGAFVERGAMLACLREDLGPSVLARVPVGEARGITDGLSAEVEGVRGKLRVDRTKTDGLVDIWFSPEAAGRVLADARIGESVALTIEIAAAGEPVVAVPSTAIFREGITPTVLVRDDHDEDRFETRSVTPGKTVNGWTEVTDLPAGTEVVVKGLYELRQALPSDGAAKRVAGHFHADGKFHAGGHDDEEE